MPHKSLQYYKNTVILKLAARASWQLDKMGLMSGMKFRTKKQLEVWLDMPSNHGSFQPVYTAYSFLNDPEELTARLDFDENGMPIGWRHAAPTAHNPLMVSYLSLVHSNHFLATGDENSKEKLISILEFLSSFGKADSLGFWLPYYQSVPKFGLKAPWYSGLAQAVAVSAFIRGFECTGRNVYLEKATQLCRVLLLPSQSGGLLENIEGGGAWIQEYPSKQIGQVLNGSLFCLIGLYEYKLKCNNLPQLPEVLSNCEATLFDRLPSFLVGRYTRYAWGGARFSNIEYQGLYVFLFLHLFYLSGKPVYLALAKRFHRNTDWSAFFRFYGIAFEPARLPKILCEP